MQKEFTKLNSRGKVNKQRFFNGIISISLFAVLALPLTSLAFTLPDRQAGLPTAPTGQAGYDSYLLFTEHVGKTLAQSITAGVKNTAQLYSSAWNEIVFLTEDATQVFPKVPLLLASYIQSSNDLGRTFANTLHDGAILTPTTSYGVDT